MNEETGWSSWQPTGRLRKKDLPSLEFRLGQLAKVIRLQPDDVALLEKDEEVDLPTPSYCSKSRQRQRSPSPPTGQQEFPLGDPIVRPGAGKDLAEKLDPAKQAAAQASLRRTGDD